MIFKLGSQFTATGRAGIEIYATYSSVSESPCTTGGLENVVIFYVGVTGPWLGGVAVPPTTGKFGLFLFVMLQSFVQDVRQFGIAIQGNIATEQNPLAESEASHFGIFLEEVFVKNTGDVNEAGGTCFYLKDASVMYVYNSVFQGCGVKNVDPLLGIDAAVEIEKVHIALFSANLITDVRFRVF